ncbi:MAG TPA: hypothetical protein VFT29_08745 [Gemmatimonadaceae bacterium]|nr:hypothetical protein [Gemmatimonadaceae bacterium]
MHARFRVSVLALVTVAAITAATSPASAQHDAHAAGHARGRAPAIGTIVFPNSGNAAAQEPFLRGVAFLHNFEYAAAADAFRAAQKADPGFALAYWGEALTYSHVVWRTEDLRASHAALQGLGATTAERLAKAKTSRERQFGAAVEAFYMSGALAQRVRAYADSLRKFAQANPADQEAAAFASHALMMDGFLATSPSSRDALLREAIALSQKVILSNANHPGATHYLIHLYDSPGLAAQGLEFARAYDKIAPDAEHALHMPSHIYLQLGMWSDAVSSNERAWAASRADNAPSWHTLSWLQYGYLQQGRWASAQALIDTARAIVPTLRGYEADGAFVVSRLEFQYAASSGQWTRPLTQPPPAMGEMSDREAGFRRFAAYWSAVDAAQRNDAAALARFAAPFVARADSVLAGTSPGAGPAVALANAFVVHALVAKSRGDTVAYLGSLRAATEQEGKLEAFVGPPERVFASELLGNELIARRRGADAVSHFETVLRLCPGRSEALLGLARARTAAGDRAGADEAFARLRANYSHADAAARALLGDKE